MPVESILIRLMMGWVHPLVTPGIFSFSFSSLMISSLVMPFLHSFLGFSSMIVSIIGTGALSVAELMRPALPSTFFTSGTVVMILSWICRMRFISALEASGSAMGMNRIVPSFSGGMNSLPSRDNRNTEKASASMLMVNTVFFHSMHQANTGSYKRVKKLLTGFLLSGRILPFISSTISTGIMVIARIMDDAITRVLVQASG